MVRAALSPPSTSWASAASRALSTPPERATAARPSPLSSSWSLSSFFPTSASSKTMFLPKTYIPKTYVPDADQAKVTTVTPYPPSPAPPRR